MYLARKLGRTVHELRMSITPAEYQAQYVYDRRRVADAERARGR